MASVGPNSPGTTSGATWTSPGNITASDNSRATYAQGGGGASDAIVATNFNFSAIPDGSTIDGVIVVIERSASTGTPSVATTGNLVHGGSPIAFASQAVGGEGWTTTDANTTLGDAANLWNVTTAELTAAVVKASTFGVQLDFADEGFDAFDFQLDHVTMTVHYTEAAGGRGAVIGTPAILRPNVIRGPFS